jgi:replication fork protection complex subunit Csm3/Swi3
LVKVALSVWHDEAKGLVNGVRMPTADDDNDSDEDSEADDAPRDNEIARAAAAATTTPTADEDAATSSTSPPSSPARSRLRHSGGSGGMSATSDSDRNIDAPHLSSDDAPCPPSLSPDRDRDEAAIELDALLEAEAASTHNATSTTGHAWKGTLSNGDAIVMDEDEDLWDALDMDTDAGAVVVAASAPATATTPAPPAMDDDEEMWDIMHELEQEKKAKETVAHPPDPVQVPPPPAAAASVTQPETDDLDDLYL